MKRQDTHILKALLSGRVHTPFPHAAKVMAEIAPSLPIIYMGDRDLVTDEVLNYMPSNNDPPALMGESTYDQYIFMLKMANYRAKVDDMPLSAREQYREGEVDIWAYINHNPSVRFIYDEEGEVALDLSLGDATGRIDQSGVSEESATKLRDIYTERTGGLEHARWTNIMLVIHTGKGAYEWCGTVTESTVNPERFTVEGTAASVDFFDDPQKFIDNYEVIKAPHYNLGEELRQVAVTVTRSISCLNNYLKYGEKHMVEVLPAKSKKQRNNTLTKNRPWLNATGPHVLLLDRMPTTQTEHQGGTHASPKPHRRRGHWKTLQHPKYRHHPQYQKQIYIKPTFVGPREVTYEGNIYRLVEPLEDILD
jgi:hypothetical protein